MGLIVAMGAHKGLRCGDCEAVYPFPKNEAGIEFRRNKERGEVCPVCDSMLTVTIYEVTISAEEMLDLWEARQKAILEEAVGHMTPTEAISGA